MGCAGSKAVNVATESPLSEALERKLVEAIIGIKRRKSFVVKKSSFNNLMLQLPKLTLGFKKIREAYASITTEAGKITLGALRSVCDEKLGMNPDSESLKGVLTMPEGFDGMKVSHPDLIIIYTVVFLVDSGTKQHTITSPEVRACLDLMEKSFMFFDSSADGRIERKELAMAMKSGTRVFGRKASKTLADQLFDQLDWSRDGQITFREFLVGMERIIIETSGDMDDEDMDDEDEDLKEMDGDWEDDEVKQLAAAEAKAGAVKEEEKVEEKEKPAAASPVTAQAATDEVRPFTLNGMSGGA